MINVEKTLEREITDERIRWWELWLLRILAALWAYTFWLGPRDGAASDEFVGTWYEFTGYVMTALAYLVPAFIAVRLGFHAVRWCKDRGYLSP